MPHSNFTNEAPVHPRTRLYLLFDQISNNNANLGNVEIRYEGLEDEECFQLGRALTTNWMVNTLDLTSNQLSGAGTSKILLGLQNISSRVSFLNLSSNPVGLEGATAIGMLLNINTAIRMLNLHECNIGNDGLVVLSHGLAANRSLDKLVLSKNSIE
jgi:Ran GTPase-activating protein (RanGAP) involved in mRNA processing and transport